VGTDIRAAYTVPQILAAALAAACAGADYRLAIIIEPRVQLAALSRDALEVELATLLAPAGVALEIQEAAPVNYLGVCHALVSVRIEGDCEATVPLRAGSVNGPLGWVLQLGGMPQLLVVIDCPAVAAHITQVFQTHHWGIAKPLLGRALARVLTHELLHWATQSAEHGQSLLFSPAIGPYALIDQGVSLTAEEVRAVQSGMQAMGSGTR
jgi:hypothetical protein